MATYLDTSALVKLVVAEAESVALRAWLTERQSELVTSDLARTALMRAVRRAAPDRVAAARDVLDVLVLTEVTSRVFEAAGRLSPDVLRSLDAIHVAAALDLGDDLDAFVTYDERMATAATSNGIRVVAPGREEQD